MTSAPCQLEHLPLDALVPYARNSRTHSPEQVAQVAASIREFGFTNPVLIAAERLRMRARLMELDPKFCDVIVRRWQDFTGQRATHAETGDPFPEASRA